MDSSYLPLEKQTKEEIQIEGLRADIKRKEDEIKGLRAKMDTLDETNQELYILNFKSLDQQIDRANQQIDRANEQISLILGSTKPKDEVWEYISNLVDFKIFDFSNGDNGHRCNSFIPNNERESHRRVSKDHGISMDNSFNRLDQRLDNNVEHLAPIFSINFPTLSFDFREIWKVMHRNMLLGMGKDKLE